MPRTLRSRSLNRLLPHSFRRPQKSYGPCFLKLEIIEAIGHGGMGAVYKARQIKLDRLVAFKVIRPEAATDASFAERFTREARTLARLDHPNIVSVHDFGEVELEVSGETKSTLYFFVMEHVRGANLRQLIEPKELAAEQAMLLVPKICEALQYAYDEGVVHRDIKPENILVGRSRQLKIADFGLAKLIENLEDVFTLTGTNQVMGTPRYMAPEQMEGSHRVDHRADIFSLGVVFYEMLTGQIPAGHFEPPSKKVAIDVRLDDIVLRSMARDPERRYQQASDVKSISQHNVTSPVVHSTVPTNSWDRWWARRSRFSAGMAQTVMIVIFLVCCGLFFGSNDTWRRIGVHSSQAYEGRFVAGWPQPWFERHVEQGVGAVTRVSLLSTAWLVLIGGHLVYLGLWESVKARAKMQGKRPTRFSSPLAMSIASFVLLVLVVNQEHKTPSFVTVDDPSIGNAESMGPAGSMDSFIEDETAVADADVAEGGDPAEAINFDSVSDEPIPEFTNQVEPGFDGNAADVEFPIRADLSSNQNPFEPDAILCTSRRAPAI